MLPVVTTAEMRALDKATSDEIGIPGFTLMETAGRGVADAAVRLLEARGVHHDTVMGHPGSIAVVCGPGNNGGDGFVIARVLRSRGLDAIAYLAVDRAVVKGDALAHLHVLERSGGVVLAIATRETLDRHRDAITKATLVIDALFGIGTTRPIEGHFAQVIDAINRAPLRLAVDLPSGLETDTGATLGVAVDAHATVTMAALKAAVVSAPGFARSGEVTIVDIGVPPTLLSATPLHAGLVERADVQRWLPRPTALDHKGKRGHVLVVGGKPEMRGAGRLAAMAALRAGAGLVTLTADAPPELAVDDPANSVMTRIVQSPADLAGALAGKDVVVIGPGLGNSDHARSLLAVVLASGVPAVLDADALNLAAERPLVMTPQLAAALRLLKLSRKELAELMEEEMLANPILDAELEAAHREARAATPVPLPVSQLATAAGPIAITPHPAEAARLLGCTTADVEADRLGAARRLAALTRAVVVLKGARTIVCDGMLGDTFCSINPTGGPALGTAGSGDVLAGALAALLAQGCPAVEAARVAVYVHGVAGERVGATHGQRGAISSDLPAEIAYAIRELQRTE